MAKTRRSKVSRIRRATSRKARARTKRAGRKAPARAPALFYLRFFELDVFARARIILLEAQLLGLRARVLLGHVEKARVGGADELDLDGCWLGHRSGPNAEKRKAA